MTTVFCEEVPSFIIVAPFMVIVVSTAVPPLRIVPSEMSITTLPPFAESSLEILPPSITSGPLVDDPPEVI